MKRVIALLTTIIIFCAGNISIVAFAEEKVVGGAVSDTISWTYDTETKTLSVTGTGKMERLSNIEIPWFDYKWEIKNLIIGEGITQVDNFAFLSYIEKVELPSTVTAISYEAFFNCTNLKTIDLPKGIVKINNNAFDGCHSLETITIDGNPNGNADPFPELYGWHITNPVSFVYDTGNGYFVRDGILYSNHDGYIETTLENSNQGLLYSASYIAFNHNCLEVYPGGRIDDTYVVPSDVFVMNQYCFLSPTYLEKIVIPNSVAKIKSHCFWDSYNYGKAKTIIFQHDTFPEDVSRYALYDMNVGSKVVVKNEKIKTEFENNEFYTMYDDSVMEIVVESIPTTTLEVAQTQLSVKIKEKGELSVVRGPAVTTDSLTYVSNNENVISFINSEIGYYEAKGEGTAVITVKSGDQKAQCIITVICDHEETVVENVASVTCTKNGYTGDERCVICNQILVKGNVIPAPGHNTITVDSYPATCERDGYTLTCCTVCSKQWTTATEMSYGHKYTDYILNPTCIEEGQVGYICEDCGAIRISYNMPTMDHIYWEEITKEPTCTEEGIKTYFCNKCGYSYAETIEGKHKYIETFVIEATCNEVGKKVYICSDCGDTYEEIIPAEHNLIINNEPATYFKNGYKNRKVCSECNEIVCVGTTLAKLKLKTPTIKVIGGKKKITVECKKVKDATGFQVKYKIGRRFHIKTFSTKKNVTKVIRNLAKGNYKIKVRAYITQDKTTAYSNWSKVKKCKVV